MLTLATQDFLLFDSCLRSARLVAIVAGFLVFFDLFRSQTYPACTAKANARAWSLVAFGAVAGGIISLHATYELGERIVTLELLIGRTILWFFVGVGLVYRAACRAERPCKIWTTACLLGVAGIVVSLLDAWIG